MKLLEYCWHGPRFRPLIGAVFLTVAIAIADVKIAVVYLAFLQLFPMVLFGTVLRSWHLVPIALFLTIVSHFSITLPSTLTTALPQDILLFIALSGTGLLMRQVTITHHAAHVHHDKLNGEIAARRDAEEQLEILIQSAPMAVLVIGTDGRILKNNLSANRLFHTDPGELPGMKLERYLPTLARVPLPGQTTQTFRTEMQCLGRRKSNEPFLANVYFSTYATSQGSRLAAFVVDGSGDLRDRAEQGLEQLLSGSRMVVAAVSHEVRNISSAMALVYENLIRNTHFRKDQDFQALGSLIDTLTNIAAFGLRSKTNELSPQTIDLHNALEEIRIVLDLYCTESEINLTWNFPEELPLVKADRHGLLQVFLNLARNSCRALEEVEFKKIDVSAVIDNKTVVIRFCDNGPGIAAPEVLFRPLQTSTHAQGLGLFLSRAYMQFFGGTLRHDSDQEGCCFVLEIPGTTASMVEESYMAG